MGYHVLDDELKKLVQQVCRQFMNSFQPRPKRGRRVRRGGGAGGVGKNTSIVQATAAIPPGSGTPRVPGLSLAYSNVKGDTITGDVENWSLVEIPINVFMVILEIDGDNVIVSAFC